MGHITKRSLFPIGDGGFAITIPKSWCVYYDLKPKEKLIAISDGFIILLPEKLKIDEKLIARLFRNLCRVYGRELDQNLEDGEAESV